MSLTSSRLLALSAIITLVTALETSTHAQKREEGEGEGGGDEADSLTGPHGAIACIAYLLFVVGAILMRVLNGPKVWLYHAATQSIGLLLAVVGAGMGIWIAMTTDQLDSAHAIIGLILFASIWFIAFGGLLQHMAFRKYKRRTIIGHVHMWVARAMITLAFVNGGLGLALSGSGTGEKAAYGVVAALVWLAWMGITFFWKGGKK